MKNIHKSIINLFILFTILYGVNNISFGWAMTEPDSTNITPTLEPPEKPANIFEAAKQGDIVALEKFLIDEDPNIRNARERTPLHFAATAGHENVIQLLVKLGADLEVMDSIGSTPLHYAARNGQVDALRALINLGANPDAQDEIGTQPIHAAAFGGNEAAIKLLASQGANVNVRNFKKSTPLHFAAQRGNTSAIQGLYDLGADINARDRYGAMPIHEAASQGHNDAIQVLVALGTDIDAGTSAGSSPLHVAAHNGFINTIQLLADLGANLNLRGQTGATSLHFAAQRQQADAIRLLARLGADVNARDNTGVTPAHIAAHQGDAATLAYLYDYDAVINAPNAKGQTPLTLAVEQAHTEIIPWLLQHGARTDELSPFLVQSLPLLQTINTALAKTVNEIDQIDTSILPILLTQHALRGDTEMALAILQKRIREIPPQLLVNLILVLVKGYVALISSPDTEKKRKDIETRISLIQELAPYTNPRLGLGYLTRLLLHTPPGNYRNTLQELYALLTRTAELNLRERLLFRIARTPITLNEITQLPIELVNELFIIQQPTASDQLRLINEAIETGNARAFTTLLGVFNLSKESLQELLGILASGELTEENIEVTKQMITALLNSGANPAETAMYGIPLRRWLHDVVLRIDELLDEDDPSMQHSHRRQEIITLLGITQQPAEAEATPQTQVHPSLPLPEIISPPPIIES